MNILGITSGSDSGVALFQEGRLVLAVNEERLSRVKLDDSYPQRSLDWCLQESGLSPGDIDLICYGFANGVEQGTFINELVQRLARYAADPKAMSAIVQRLIMEASVDAAQREKFEARTLEIFPRTPVSCCHHHTAHMAGAFMASPFSEALVVTSDGRGDFKSITVSTLNDLGITECYRSYSWESLGYFYGRITHLCGFTANRHEGKIVGLAAHGNPKTAKGLMEKMIVLENGAIRTFPGDYYRPFFTNYSEHLQKEAGRYSREDLAAAAQEHLEEIMCALVEKHARKTGLRNICLSGGVFANVKLNQRLRDLAVVDDVFIYPNMGDGGICAGAVYYYMFKDGSKHAKPLDTLNLGPAVDNVQLLEMLREKRFRVERPAKLNEVVIEHLRNRQVIGLVQGRTEFGPRALGNRSILAACDSPAFCDSINDRLGRTEFMPFAPAIASNLAHRCLVDYAEQLSARHMTITYNVTPEFAENSPAVIHVDGTVRPQVVFKEDNPFFYDLLNDWHGATGGLCLINTSFNLHEDPIIATTEDIVHTFQREAVDCLLFPPYLAKAHERNR